MPTLEERVARLEAEVVRLSEKERQEETRTNSWVETIFGQFKDDPLYEQAVNAGAAYRKSQLPDYMTDDNVSA
jgi:hypothetical protein